MFYLENYRVDDVLGEYAVVTRMQQTVGVYVTSEEQLLTECWVNEMRAVVTNLTARNKNVIMQYCEKNVYNSE